MALEANVQPEARVGVGSELAGAVLAVAPAPSLWRGTLRRLRRNRGAVIGLCIICAMTLMALLAPWVAPYSPNKQFSGQYLKPPSTQHWLGTDNLGRDLLSRLIYGSRPSIGTSALAAALIVSIGISLGAWAGYAGGLVDATIMRLVDVFLALPSLLLALAIVGILGPSLANVIIGAVSIWWAGYARLVRAQVLEIRERPFVQAASALGAGQWHILARHIVPNLIGPVIVLASLEIGTLILIIAGLNFLGLGVQPPTAEWGAMLNQGRTYFQRAPQLMLYPGAMISLTVLGFNLLGDGLRDVLDPRHIE